MKKSLSVLFFIFITMTAIGQNSRLVQGIVRTVSGEPLVGAVVQAVDGSVKTQTVEGGTFELRISPYAMKLVVIYPGYMTTKIDIDGTYLIVNMKVDRNYAERKVQEEAQARQAAEREAAAKAKAEEYAREAEEKARIAAEKEAAEKAEAEKEARIAAEKARVTAEKEAAAKAKAEEEARIAAEKARIAAEKEAAEKAKEEEQKRLKNIEKEKRLAEITKHSKGYGSMIDVSYFGNKNKRLSNIGLSYIAGYRFNNHLYVGAGTGVKFNLDSESPVLSIGNKSDNYLSPSLVSIPVFAYFKANFINRRVSPFFAMAAGAQFSAKQTLHLDMCDIQYPTSNIFVNPQLGLNVRTTEKSGINFSVGLQFMTYPHCVDYSGYNATIRSQYCLGLDFHLGFTF